jgi:hypothetical protein
MKSCPTMASATPGSTESRTWQSGTETAIPGVPKTTRGSVTAPRIWAEAPAAMLTQRNSEAVLTQLSSAAKLAAMKQLLAPESNSTLNCLLPTRAPNTILKGVGSMGGPPMAVQRATLPAPGRISTTRTSDGRPRAPATVRVRSAATCAIGCSREKVCSTVCVKRS